MPLATVAHRPRLTLTSLTLRTRRLEMQPAQRAALQRASGCPSTKGRGGITHLAAVASTWKVSEEG